MTDLRTLDGQEDRYGRQSTYTQARAGLSWCGCCSH
jgi:hypothetical protein